MVAPKALYTVVRYNMKLKSLHVDLSMSRFLLHRNISGANVIIFITNWSEYCGTVNYKKTHNHSNDSNVLITTKECSWIDKVLEIQIISLY